MYRLPTRIAKEPWISPTVEIRFNPSIDKSAVFGVIYYALKDRYSSVQELVPSQIPDVIKQDLVSSAQPYYRLLGGSFYVQIGPSVFSLHCNSDYPGWTTFSEELYLVLTEIKKLNIISSVTRLGIRYISFFPHAPNIFRDLQLKVSYPNRNVTELPSKVSLTFEERPFISQLSISNYTDAIRNEIAALGSVIDIDTYRELSLESFFEDVSSPFDEAHKILKSLFFSLFTEEYLESLGPQYDEAVSN